MYDRDKKELKKKYSRHIEIVDYYLRVIIIFNESKERSLRVKLNYNVY